MPASNPLVDPLESRNLFAVTVQAVTVGEDDVLRITGDNTVDIVEASVISTDDDDDIDDVIDDIFGDDDDDDNQRFRLTVDGVQQTTVYESEDFDRIEFRGAGGSDSIILGRVNLDLYAEGGKGDDSLSGGTGDDTLYGFGGEDYLFGGRGDDVLDGGVQGDEMLGNDGDDVIYGGSTTALDDLISGGSGRDRVEFPDKYSSGRVNIEIGRTTSGDDVSDVVLDIETLVGTSFDDIISTVAGQSVVIYGLDGVDKLYGSSKSDTLVGGAGRDFLYGNGGDDVLDAFDGGRDVLFGGSGDDDKAVGTSSNDRVRDVEDISDDDEREDYNDD